MLNTTPNGLFGMAQPTTAPMQTVAPPAAFVYGAGGQRFTPDELVAQRKRAQALQAAGMDYSPVESWTQGLARVADALVGRSLEKDADKAAQANAAESNAVLQALMGDKPTNAVTVAALTNPYVSDEVRKFAGTVYDRANPKAAAPTEFERALIASGVQPGTPEWAAANAAKVTATTDPIVTTSLPGNRFYSGRQSGLAAALGMGAADAGPAVGTVQDGYRFKGGNPADQSSWEAVGGPTHTASATFR